MIEPAPDGTSEALSPKSNSTEVGKEAFGKREELAGDIMSQAKKGWESLRALLSGEAKEKGKVEASQAAIVAFGLSFFSLFSGEKEGEKQEESPTKVTSNEKGQTGQVTSETEGGPSNEEENPENDQNEVSQVPTGYVNPEYCDARGEYDWKKDPEIKRLRESISDPSERAAAIAKRMQVMMMLKNPNGKTSRAAHCWDYVDRAYQAAEVDRVTHYTFRRKPEFQHWWSNKKAELQARGIDPDKLTRPQKDALQQKFKELDVFAKKSEVRSIRPGDHISYFNDNDSDIFGNHSVMVVEFDPQTGEALVANHWAAKRQTTLRRVNLYKRKVVAIYKPRNKR